DCNFPIVTTRAQRVIRTRMNFDFSVPIGTVAVQTVPLLLSVTPLASHDWERSAVHSGSYARSVRAFSNTRVRKPADGPIVGRPDRSADPCGILNAYS